jgi:FMN phosphatase YigB (HAD superfamily)
MKYLATDLGNVIIEVNFTQFAKELSRTLNIPSEEVEYFLRRTTKLHDLGITSIADELRDHFKIRSGEIIADLVGHWNNVIKSNSYMNNFLERLIRKNVKLALLSNIGIEHSNMLVNILPPYVYDSSIKFFSCEVGARKPTYLYYKTFLDMHPEFNGSVYLDDRMENVTASSQFGLNSVHFVLDKYRNDFVRNQKLDDISKMIGV